MTISRWEQLAFIAAVTAVTAPLLGKYLAATFRGGKAPGDRVFLPVERLIYRALGADPESSWTWRSYALAVLAFGPACWPTLSGWWSWNSPRAASGSR